MADAEELDFIGTDIGGHHHVSFSDVKEIINKCKKSERAKEKALSIYSVIAKAEAEVHKTTVSEVHFHEVGRFEAIKNIVEAAAWAEALGIDRVLCSRINDGTGFIECSHGLIPVPVPAVMAMRADSGLMFYDDESIKTEMVTPSGLAILIGLGAKYSKDMPEGKVLKETVAYGKRKTGKTGGLKAYLMEV
jgi:hypothetical protein